MIRSIGPFGKKVLYFDGVDDLVTCGDVRGGKYEITIETLLKIYAPSETLIRKGQDNPDYLLEFGGADWGLIGNWVQFGIRGTDGTFKRIAEYGPIPYGVWTHIVAKYDGKYGYMYINGELVNKGNDSGYEGEIQYIQRDLLIGNWGEHFTGIVAIVRIWNRALSDNEIKRIYHEAFLMKPTSVRNGLVLELIPDTIDWENKIWKDNSGNGNDGIIHGCKLVYV